MTRRAGTATAVTGACPVRWRAVAGREHPGWMPTVRELSDADLDSVLLLNQANVPAVSSLERSSLLDLLALCELRLGVGEPLCGFALTVAEHQPYQSPNYRWFAERFEGYVYLDRIVVRDVSRRSGVGAALYDEVERRAQADWFLAEVNNDPPNDTSLAFHRARGFEPVGTARPYGSAGVEVVYLAKALGRA